MRKAEIVWRVTASHRDLYNNDLMVGQGYTPDEAWQELNKKLDESKKRSEDIVYAYEECSSELDRSVGG